MGQWLLLLASYCLSAIALAEEMAVEDLGNGRYRVGEIELHKNEGWFEVPGRVISQDAIDAPIEFLAVSEDAVKSYESVLELATTAVAFNAACILLGLDPDNASHPRFHFDPEEVEGDAVTLTLVWEAGGKWRERPLIELILVDGKPAGSSWVYTGSRFSRDGRYLAEEFGTLIGVVHDTDSVIQHRSGIGLGDYGAVVINPALGLDPGWPVSVRVAIPDVR